MQDTSRLANLSGQLLDLQRLNHAPIQHLLVDLVDIAGRVVLVGKPEKTPGVWGRLFLKGRPY
ncbi:hypothetical protein AGR5A_Lc20173 [Agrobacterium genomosp. 5 str. CFBP 6626]|nr:hypothetical protein AGR5A_Lc20173 [Agrobacterium genomosp. 5 str. CFBP 6626]